MNYSRSIYASLLLGWCVAFATVGCSHTSQVLSAESTQTRAAMAQAHAIRKKDAQVANYATQIKMLLSQPAVEQVPQVQAAVTLSGFELDLSGAPSKSETELQEENVKLLADVVTRTKEVEQLEQENAAIKKAVSATTSKLTSTTARLYEVAAVGAESADYSMSIFRWVLISLAALAAWIVVKMVLKVMENSSQAAAIVAAKAP